MKSHPLQRQRPNIAFGFFTIHTSLIIWIPYGDVKLKTMKRFGITSVDGRRHFTCLHFVLDIVA